VIDANALATLEPQMNTDKHSAAQPQPKG